MPSSSRPSLPARLAILVALAALASGCSRVGLDPSLEAAWVAIRVAGEEVATVGRVEIEAGREFTLHAVAEARDWQGETFYYTEAPGLQLGGRRIADDRVRPWDRRLKVRNLWFTVEAFPLWAENDELAFRDVFRGDWPLSWSVAGDIAPSVENYLPNQAKPRRGARFGTQRFKVRIEILGPESDILPRLSLESWGADRLPDAAAAFPTVVAVLPAELGPVSRVFGLAQREPRGAARGAARAAALERIAVWQRQDLAFSHLILLRRWTDEIGTTLEDLPWREVDLEGGTAFGASGEPLRVGERVVWLFDDRGVAGRLDRDDLCLDFERGARVRPLFDVFAGEGLVERAGIRTASSTGRV